MGDLTPDQWGQQWRAHLNSGTPWGGAPGNQLTHVGDNNPTTPQTHSYDANGNMTAETTSRHFEWDHGDRMRAFSTQTAAAEPSLYAVYLYDATGQRIKKLVRNQGGVSGSTVYVDGTFEHARWAEAGAAKQNNQLHVMDDKNGVAITRFGDVRIDDLSPAVQYHLGDHLGSGNVIVDGAGAWINREEYLPYGETGFGSFARKRYRFTGREREEENGLNYHGARYYAPWLARWISCDPSGPVDGTNLFKFSVNSPVTYTDRSGRGAASNNLGASGEKLFSKVLEELDKIFRKQVPFSGGEEVPRSEATSIVDFLFEKGDKVIHSVDIKSRDILNWLTKEGKLDRSRIIAKETNELAKSAVKHMGDTDAKETMLYVLKNATPEQAAEYAEIVAKVHQQSTSAFRPGLGVTTFDKLTRMTDQYFSGVFKRSGGALQRIPKLKTPNGFVTLEGASELLSFAGLVLMANDVKNKTMDTYSKYEARGVGTPMAMAQAGKEAAKQATAWLWFAAGAAVALTLASGGTTAPLAAAAVGALITAGGQSATDQLIDLATPELAK
jgi:RHS repeat-associated protein